MKRTRQDLINKFYLLLLITFCVNNVYESSRAFTVCKGSKVNTKLKQSGRVKFYTTGLWKFYSRDCNMKVLYKAG